MRIIDADALDIFLENAELKARKKRKYVLASALNIIRGNVRNFPPAQPEQQWIPCSERLPEEKGVYMVTDSKGDVVRFVFDGNKSSREYWKRCAKAWMPLPEPYQERDEQE